MADGMKGISDLAVWVLRHPRRAAWGLVLGVAGWVLLVLVLLATGDTP